MHSLSEQYWAYNSLLAERPTAAHNIRRRATDPGNYAKNPAHHFRSRYRRRGSTCRRPGHARLPACALCVRRLHVDQPPQASGLTRKPLLAHGYSGVCGDCSRPGSVSYLPLHIPFSKCNVDYAQGLTAPGVRASQAGIARAIRVNPDQIASAAIPAPRVSFEYFVERWLISKPYGA
jgi:hypothetical protein